jgi:hypothetical protein
MTSTIEPGTVTWTPPAEVTWHSGIEINHEPYPTRNHAPDCGANSDAYLGSLTYAQRDTMRAVHEAAHAVAVLACGGHLHSARMTITAELRPGEPSDEGTVGGQVLGCNVPDGRALAVFTGAGERAEDRWLRESGLWTPTRAAGVELGAYSDRRALLLDNPHIGFGTGQDYVSVHDLADHFLGEHWSLVLAVADALAFRLRLDGEEVAFLAGLPNGTPMDTCDHT